MMRLHRSSVVPSSLIWPTALVITVLNYGIWLLADSGAAWKALPLAIGMIIAAAIGVAVELAHSRASNRQAIWDAYADREIARGAVPLDRSPLQHVHSVAAAFDTHLKQAAGMSDRMTAYFCVYDPGTVARSDGELPAPGLNQSTARRSDGSFLCFEVRAKRPATAVASHSKIMP